MKCGCGGVVIGGQCQYCHTIVATQNPKQMNKLVVDEFVVVAVAVGVLSSVAANYIYDKWKDGRRQ